MKKPRARRGAVTGYVFKLVRESIPRSQEQLAVELGVDRGTIQGWESGRRPLTSIPFGQALALRHKLVRLGADLRLLAAWDQAAEADYLMAEVIETDPNSSLNGHVLGWSVMTHALVDMIAWAVAGQVPQAISEAGTQPARRRGPVSTGPYLDTSERAVFFSNLRTAADRTKHNDGSSILLHRQACFLGGLDQTKTAASWLSPATSAYSYFTHPQPWSPLWVDARSLATSLACQGDPQPLRDFIAHAHSDPIAELAGLTYWAYWVGEIDRRQPNDLFMTDQTLRWRGNKIFRHIVDRLHHQHVYIDLNIHTLWALFTARRGLAYEDPDTAAHLVSRGEQLLDEGGISDQSRQELTSVLYGLRMDGINPAKGEIS